MSNGRDLSDIRLPISVDMGGTGKTTEFRKGFIDGFKLVWVNPTTVRVTAGSAYVPALGTILQMTADKTLSFATTTAQTHYHLYLYLNSGVVDVGVDVAVPQNYYGTAYQRFNDGTRRYLGSVLSNTTATGIWQFTHYPERSTMLYNVAAPSVAPFNQLWQGFTSTTAVLVDPLVVAPREILTELLTVSSSGAQFLAGCSADATNSPPGPGNWTMAVAGVAPFDIHVARSGANIGKFYIWLSAAGASSGFVRGYRFER